MPERIDFWGIPLSWGPIIVYSLVSLAALILVIRLVYHARMWRQIGLVEKRWDHLPLRFWLVIKYGIVQMRVLNQLYPGIMHVALAWSFFIMFLGTALATINGHFFVFLQGIPYLLYKLTLDIFSVVFIIGAAMAAYRRFIRKPDRLTYRGGFTWSLLFLVFIVVNGLLIESFRLAIQKPEWAFWSPVGWALAQIWIASGATSAVLDTWHLVFYIIHFVTVAIFFVTFPAGTLLHVITGPLNVFFSKVGQPEGRLASIPLNLKSEPVFVDRVAHLSWKQLLDGEACTECGRCQDVCPAFSANGGLSPKKLIVDVRNLFHEEINRARSGKGEPSPLVNGRIKEVDIWACTTCGACDEECPVLVEHVDTIVAMRRSLVNDGRIDVHLQETLTSLTRYGNSFGQSDRGRAKWSAPLPSKIKDARKEPVKYLWFVGDYASYNTSLAEITRKSAEFFLNLGLDFGILYEAERNAGNDVRRAGEEGLFEFLVEKNTAALAKCNFESIITTDPHTYNTLKNEYPADALSGRPVIHYTQLLDNLITSGQIILKKKVNSTVTYHDPCYLSRYNGIITPPRRILNALGYKLVELPRHGKNTFCCGAGGGRIWMEEGVVKERPSENRVREAASLANVSTLVVACPKDMVMFRDALKTTALENRLVIKDIIELVNEAL